jgi:hypothetical protein
MTEGSSFINDVAGTTCRRRIGAIWFTLGQRQKSFCLRPEIQRSAFTKAMPLTLAKETL